MELKGKVILRKFAEGSKSEHEAVFLDTGNKVYRLKIKGGNPFYDAALHKLIGKDIKAEGQLTSHFFEITLDPEVL